MLNCMRQKRTHVALNATDKVKVQLQLVDDVQLKYFNSVTSFAYSLLLNGVILRSPISE